MNSKKLLSLFLTVCLLFSNLITPVFAVSNSNLTGVNVTSSEVVVEATEDGSNEVSVEQTITDGTSEVQSTAIVAVPTSETSPSSDGGGIPDSEIASETPSSEEPATEETNKNSEDYGISQINVAYSSDLFNGCSVVGTASVAANGSAWANGNFYSVTNFSLGEVGGVSGKNGFCILPLSVAPGRTDAPVMEIPVGSTNTNSKSNLYRLIRLAMYYGYGGPGYENESNPCYQFRNDGNDSYLAVHYAIAAFFFCWRNQNQDTSATEALKRAGKAINQDNLPGGKNPTHTNHVSDFTKWINQFPDPGADFKVYILEGSTGQGINYGQDIVFYSNEVTANEIPMEANAADKVTCDITVNVKKVNAINEPIYGATFNVVCDKEDTVPRTLTTDSSGLASTSYHFERAWNITPFTYYYIENWDSLSSKKQAEYTNINTGNPGKDGLIWYSSYEACQTAVNAERNRRITEAKKDIIAQVYTITASEVSVPAPYIANYPADNETTKSWAITWGDSEVHNLDLWTVVNYTVNPDHLTRERSAEEQHEIALEVKKWNDNTKNPEWPDEGLEGFKFEITERNKLLDSGGNLCEYTTGFNNGIYETNSSGTIYLTWKHNWSATRSSTKYFMDCDWRLLCEQDKLKYADYIHFDGPNGGDLARAEADKQANAEALASAQHDVDVSADAEFEYTVVEREVPPNYTIDTTPQVQTGVGSPSSPLQFHFDQKNHPQMGTITVRKEGPRLEEVVDGTGNQYKKFVYGDGPLAGAVYEIYAEENIKRSQHYRVYDKGDLVATIITGEDGTAVSPLLYNGKYRVVEVQAPEGYTLPENQEDRERVVNLAYEGMNVELVYANVDYKNDRPINTIDLTKRDDFYNVPVKNAQFTLYNKSDIKNYKGEVVLPHDTAIELAITNADGKTSMLTQNLPIGYEYYITETTAPTNYNNHSEEELRTFNINYEYENDTTYVYKYTHEFVNTPQFGNIKIYKFDEELFKDPVRTPENDIIYRDGRQGDATLAGAIYGLYARSNIMHPADNGTVLYEKDTEVARLTIEKYENDEYSAYIEQLPLGEYYIKEIQAPTGYLIDKQVYNVDLTYDGQWAEVGVTTVNPANRNSNEVVSLDEVMTQPIKLLKYLPSEINPSVPCPYLQGAEFTIKLESDIENLITEGKSEEEAWELAETYEVLTTDEWGVATSKELPYGTYIVRETKMPDEHDEDLYKVNDFKVVIDHDEREYQIWRILPDGPVDVYVRIYKVDKDTGKEILVPGATFQILQDGEVYKQKVGDKWIDTFETNEEGWVQLPLMLESGTFTLTEIHAPEGYLVNDDDLDFTISLNTPIHIDEDGDAVMDIRYRDEAVMGQIQVTKKGEVLVGAEKAEDGSLQYTNFKYEIQNLAGAEFEVRAQNDILRPDRNGEPLYKAGALVCKLTTGADGTAKTPEIPLGEYTITETKAPGGFIISSANQITKDVTLSYLDEVTPLIFDDSTVYINTREKVDLNVLKVDKNTSEPLSGATFALYAAEDIRDVAGNVVVAKDGVVELAMSDVNGHVDFVSDLPLANYYIKEVIPPLGYVTQHDRIEVNATYRDQNTPVVTLEYTSRDVMTMTILEKFDDLSNFEIAGATMQILETNNNEDDLQVIDGAVVDEWESVKGESHVLQGLVINTWYALVEKTAPRGYVLNDEPIFFMVKDDAEPQTHSMTNEQVRGKIEITKIGEKLTGTTIDENGRVQFTYEELPLEGVIFNVYAAEDIINVDGNSAIWYKAGDLVQEVITGREGKVLTNELPLGKYYVQETKTLNGFVLDTARHDVAIEYEDQTVPLVIAPITLENIRQTVKITLRKTDIETGEPIPGTEFTLYCRSDILSTNGDVILKANTPISVAVADEQGNVDFGVDIPLGYIYYAKETKPAPGYTTNGGDADIYEFDASYIGPDEEFVPSGDLHAEDQKTKHVFRKIDLTTREPLDGAVLEVLHVEKDANGNLLKENGEYVTTLVEAWTSRRDETCELLGQTYNGHSIEGLIVGDTYIFREVMAPFGYVGYNASNDTTKQANRDANEITEEIMFVVEDTKVVIEHEFKDQATVGRIVVDKTGEVLTSIEEPNLLEKIGAYIARAFNYLFGSIEDVTYEIYAAEDIVHPDGVTGVIYHKGDLVETITTNAFGRAVSRDLPLGKYTIKEVVAGDGLTVNKEAKDVELSYVNQDVAVVSAQTAFVNQRQKVDIQVVKKSAFEDEYEYVNTNEEVPEEENDLTLAGAVFGLYNRDTIYANVINEDGSVVPSEDVYLEPDTLIEVAVSSADGIAHFESDLPLGWYYVKELETPVGYHTSDEAILFNCSYRGQDVDVITLSYDFYNMPTIISITKIATDTGEGLVGAELTVYDDNDNVVDTWVTDGTVHYIKHLELGKTYTLKETKTPAGYVTFDPMTFTIHDKTEEGELIKLERLSPIVDDITKVKISKKDMTTGEELPGAKLQLFDEEGNLVDEWTSTEEEHYIEKLPVGKYRLHEEITPDGYVTAEDVEFTVEDTGEIQEAEMLDDITKVKISKKDMTTGEELPGAKLQLFDEEDNLVDEWTSTEEEHYIEKLPVGKYRLHEEITPDGYVTAEDVEFTVENTGEIQEAEMLDDITRVKISKKDMTTGEELPGAKLQLFNEEGNLIDEWVSTEEEHYIEKLPVGKYRLHEETAPDGYVTAEDVEFTVEDTGEIQEAEMLDDVTKVEISKKDMTTGEELPCAKLQLFDEEGNLIDEWVTDGTPHYVEKLPVGKYTLREETAPDGYVTAEDVEFTVDDTGEIQKAEMLDDVTKVEISKKDMTTGEELPGAKLQLFDENGNLIDEWITDGTPHYIEKLPVGKYTLREITAPDGYVTAEDVEFTVDDTGEIQKVEMLDDVTKVDIWKKESVDKKPLAGAVMQIIDASGNVVKEWTSSANEAFHIEKLPVGEYKLHEAEAPSGYSLHADITFKVEDTGELQTFEMEDTPIEVVKTGEDQNNYAFLILALALVLVAELCVVITMKKKHAK